MPRNIAQVSMHAVFHLPGNLTTKLFLIIHPDTWWTCLILHDILAIFYFVWFVVGVTVALWVEILPNHFGRIVEYTFGPVTLLGGMVRFSLIYLTESSLTVPSHSSSTSHS